ncbi:MAG: hypothetical protein Q9163_005738 [Psora crenata]
MAMDPEWIKRCADFMSYNEGQSFAILDPPRTLSIADDLVPDPVEVPVAAPAEPTPVVDPIDPPKVEPAQSQVLNLPGPISAPDSAGPDQNTPGEVEQPKAGDTPNVEAADPPNAAPNGANSAEGPSKQAGDPTQASPDFGELIVGRFGDGPPNVNTAPDLGSPPSPVLTTSNVPINDNPTTSNISPPTPAPGVFTVAGKIFTADPAGFQLAGSTLSPGRSPVTIAGTPVSLGPSGGLAIGNSTVELATITPVLDVFTAAGATGTLNPIGFALGGATLHPGGPPVTIFPLHPYS